MFSRSMFLRRVGRYIQAKQPCRDGFQVSDNPFMWPENSAHLAHNTKRALIICDLFVNHCLPIDDIASLLEENRKTVILALIERNIIHDRRQSRFSGTSPSPPPHS